MPVAASHPQSSLVYLLRPRLTRFLGDDSEMSEITPGEAPDRRRWLEEVRISGLVNPWLLRQLSPQHDLGNRRCFGFGSVRACSVHARALAVGSDGSGCFCRPAAPFTASRQQHLSDHGTAFDGLRQCGAPDRGVNVHSHLRAREDRCHHPRYGCARTVSAISAPTVCS